MKTKAGVIWNVGEEWDVVELELDPPKEGEVLVRWEASGICHTDEHICQGDFVPYVPVVGGHEGAGVVEEVGPGVMTLKPGDHVVGSWIACCGTCRWCASGRSNLCDNGARIGSGSLEDGTYRFHGNGKDLGQFLGLGTFAQRSVIDHHSAVKIDPSLPLDVACLVGCAVPTGWGSSVNVAKVEPGETVVIYGLGGVGMNAVQGAAHAGAANIVAVDILPNKLEPAKTFGATHVANSAEEALPLIMELTRGVGADKTILTAGIVPEELVRSAVDATRKGGTTVLTGCSNHSVDNIVLNGQLFYCLNKTFKGHLYGECNPHGDIPRLLDLYQKGEIKLDEMVTKRYSLEELVEGFKGMRDGKNIRGVIIHEH